MDDMDNKTFAVDRIESGAAICECLETGLRITLDAESLPKGTKEGDILQKTEKGFVIDKAQTDKRLQDLTSRMNRLFDRHK